MRPGAGPPGIAWPWLAGMGIGVVVIVVVVWARVATRMHELWRQVVSRQFQLQQVLDLAPDRLDPHANAKNILVIVGVLLAASFLEPLVGHDRMHRIIPPAFSICVMLGVVATFTTYLGMKRWPARIAVVFVMLALMAATGTLSYEVEVRDLSAWYPSAFNQLRDQVIPRAPAPRSVPVS